LPLKVTTKEIAQICGVSIGTVDRALNNRGGINAETRARVLGVAKQLGYRPHLLARSLATGSTNTIGIVALTLRNPFFSELVEAIEKKASAAGYHVFLALSEFGQKEEETCLERLRALNVDGIIISPVSRGNAFVAYLRRLSTPVVTISNRISKNWPWVGINERAAAGDIVGLAFSKGYERVIFVTQSREPGKVEHLDVDDERVQGYRDAVRAAGRAAPEVYSDKEICQVIERSHEFSTRTCIACTCDAVALDAMNMLKQHSIKVPDQVGLMGMDNLEVLKYVTPRLSTVSYPIEKMGEVAFDCLMAEMRHNPMGSQTLSYSIVQGETI
jgi:LacI family transcriptional regulator